MCNVIPNIQSNAADTTATYTRRQQASSRHVSSANNYTAASGKRAFSFSPFAEISGISIVMYVSQLFVDGKCIIGSVVRRTLARGRHLLFYAILTCRILP